MRTKAREKLDWCLYPSPRAIFWIGRSDSARSWQAQRYLRLSTVRLAVYALDGKLVRELANGTRSAGFHTEDWDGRNNAGREMPSGVYLSRMIAGGYQGVQKMHLVR